MSRSTRRIAGVAIAGACAAALAAPALAAPTAGSSTGSAPGKTQFPIQILSFNDFHGNLEAPTGSSGKLQTGPLSTNTTEVGGVEYLASHLKRARVGHPNTVTVAAGDMVGASPLLSAAFHDEPTVESLNSLGLDITAVGNHEFDEGFKELQRLQNGGCIDDGDGANNQNSCPAGTFTGANFQYLAANVLEKSSGRTILPPYAIKNFNGAKVGFIGMTLKETPNIVTASGVAGLEFTDEVATANKLVPVLKAQGVNAIVVLLHQGGNVPASTPYDFTCKGGGTLSADSPIIPIAKGLDPAIDMIISGHTHQPYVCNLPDPEGKPRLVTSASSFGRLYTETNVTYDRRTSDIVRPTQSDAVQRLVTRDVADAAQTELIAKYKKLVKSIADKVLGQIVGTSVSKAQNAAGESSLGDLIADAQVADPSVVTGGKTPVVAFMNPGGIRADLAADANGNVTYASAFTVQPFNNYLVSMDVTGQGIYDLLNQQFNGTNSAGSPKVLQISNGFTYSYTQLGKGTETKTDDTASVDDGSVKLNGVPVDKAATYRIVTNNFLSDGGDGFPAFKAGTGKYFGGLDIDGFAAYLTAHSPYSPLVPSRISRLLVP
ncbi:MAG: bifunctional metallophosphatase/5'-nucleotidase [Dermatophilaceae bacterium]|nr:bifunctional metallophosphatase/5'-nucleotidase [Dermatophilaceae bacterium]NUO90050.1 bifunctional metallophosphatase/5'-nucleotidase [Dermatophilaceae bacterium]NUR80477.1 bifunctional metallophosphatase/5'-nucleotidase [Dermatophilaceae bacterium]